MIWTFYVTVSLLVAAVVGIAWIRAIDAADERARTGMPLPTARQVRQWRRDRLTLAVGNRKLTK